MTAPYEVLLGVGDTTVGDIVAAMIREIDDATLAGGAGTTQALLSQTASHLPEVILLSADLAPVPVLDAAREISVRFPDVGIVLLTADVGSDLLRSALSSGVRDVVALPVALEELQAAIAHAGQWSRAIRARHTDGDAHDQPPATGSMLAIAGAKGGVGATLIASQLALTLRALGVTVCLVDLDLLTGDVRHLLDISHRRSIADLVAVADQITARQLDDSLYQHASGLRVLLPPRHGDLAEEVTGPVTRQVLGALRSRFDVVIIDLGAVTSEASAVAAHMADQIVVVATPDVLALRSANRLLALWDRLGVRTGTGVLLNRTDRSNEVQPDLVVKVVDTEVLDVSIPATFRSLEAAVNTGDPDRARSSPLRHAITQLASELGLVGRSPAETVRPRVRGRRLRPASELGQVAVEMVGMLPLVLLSIVLLWQGVLIGGTFILAEHAAREGARELAVGDDASAAALADLPAGWRRSARVSTADDEVRVDLPVPALVPGVASPWAVTSSAGAIVEDGV